MVDSALELTGAERLRHERVEAEKHAHAEDGGREEQDAAKPHGANGLRCEPADHERVDDAHEHPAELGDDDRPGERQRGGKLRPCAREVFRCRHDPVSVVGVKGGGQVPGTVLT